MRVVLKIVVVAVLLWAGAVSVVFAFNHGGRPVQADAVVVLEGSKTRLPLGLKLVGEGYAPLLVVSSGDRKNLEARLCSGRDTAVHVRILCFTASPNSTRGEAEFIGRFAQQRGLSRIDVVTSQFHLFRAHLLIRRCYHGEVRMVGAPQQWWKLPVYAVGETVKLVYQLVVTRSC